MAIMARSSCLRESPSGNEPSDVLESSSFDLLESSDVLGNEGGLSGFESNHLILIL